MFEDPRGQQWIGTLHGVRWQSTSSQADANGIDWNASTPRLLEYE